MYQYQGDIPDMTQTQACVICPKGSAAFPPMLSGHPGALIILVRHMGHEIFERFLLHALPRAGDRKDQTPAPGGIGFIPGFDHGHVSLIHAAANFASFFVFRGLSINESTFWRMDW